MHKRILAVALSAALTTTPALAGPPILCHLIDIGNAPSLPWSAGAAWNGMLDSYSTARLADDTLALLSPQTPVSIRMETLRRAAIYASRNPQQADRLAAVLFKRKDWFDVGYFIEGVRESAEIFHLPSLPPYIASLQRESSASGSTSGL
jgi:hypothetical protein